MEEGKLDIHKPIQEYVPNFPLKTFDGSNVAITTYHLLSNTSGIRGYFDNKGKVVPFKVKFYITPIILQNICFKTISDL